MKFFLIIILVFLSTSCVSPTRDQNKNYVYHASTERGLTVLNPNKSTHQEDWVYATPYLGIVATYLGRWSDFDLGQGTCGPKGRIHLVERYKGAFEKVYKGSSGSIYTLSREGFLEGKTSFKMEVVKPGPAKVLSEEYISDPWNYLQKLRNQGELDLYFYPNRPECIPSDDSDIVDKAVKWINKGFKNTRKSFERKHPHLIEKLKEKLQSP